MTTRPHMLGRGLLLAALAVATILARPAAAHEGDPVISIDQTHPADGSTHYILKVVYDDDGDPVNDLSITATPIAPDGTEGALVTMEVLGNGMYQGTVPMPLSGTWKVRFTSIDPAASLEHTQAVTAPTTTAAPTTTTTAPSDTTIPPTSTSDSSIDTDETAAQSDDDSSSALPLIIGAVVLLAAVGGGGAYALNRRKATIGPSDDGPDAAA